MSHQFVPVLDGEKGLSQFETIVPARLAGKFMGMVERGLLIDRGATDNGYHVFVSKPEVSTIESFRKFGEQMRQEHEDHPAVHVFQHYVSKERQFITLG